MLGGVGLDLGHELSLRLQHREVYLSLFAHEVLGRLEQSLLVAEDLLVDLASPGIAESDSAGFKVLRVGC